MKKNDSNIIQFLNKKDEKNIELIGELIDDLFNLNTFHLDKIEQIFEKTSNRSDLGYYYEHGNVIATFTIHDRDDFRKAVLDKILKE